MAKTIVGVGELLWDMLPSGKALGGAPGNFAYHCSRLGEQGYCVTAIGDDDLGKEIVDALSGRNLNLVLETVPYPTGTVQVTLDEKGVPSYDICTGVAWDNIPFTPRMEALAKSADAICFGSLAQRLASKDAIVKFIKAAPESALKVFDINLRQSWYSKEVIEESLTLSDILKINDEEIVVVSRMLGLSEDPVEACREIISKYSLKLVVLTLGADGSEVITPDEVIPQPATKVEVVDTVGAGDSFTAAFIVSYLRGESLAEAQRKASETAAFVCSCKGAMPE